MSAVPHTSGFLFRLAVFFNFRIILLCFVYYLSIIFKLAKQCLDVVYYISCFPYCYLLLIWHLFVFQISNSVKEKGHLFKNVTFVESKQMLQGLILFDFLKFTKKYLNKQSI